MGQTLSGPAAQAAAEKAFAQKGFDVSGKYVEKGEMGSDHYSSGGALNVV
ncbi:hypothetical protein [Pseudomonas fluorescens]|nr:hypothetical protein [Pseudomonas fluorescens]MBC8786798.1 hypothetical protein [Pseudomonas fluorescens]